MNPESMTLGPRQDQAAVCRVQVHVAGWAGVCANDKDQDDDRAGRCRL